MTTKKTADKGQTTANTLPSTQETTPTFPELSGAPQGLLTALEQIDEKDTAEMIEASSDYMKFEEGNPVACIVTGFTEIANTYGKAGDPPTITAVQLWAKDEEGKARPYINADKVFVSTCKRLMEKANAKGLDAVGIKVVNRGEKKGDNGTYKDLAIYTL